MIQMPGLSRARVLDADDPLGRRRLRVVVPDLTPDEGAWALPCVPAGTIAQPAAGTMVWVAFEGGDPSAPVWVGTFWEPTAEVPVRQSLGLVSLVVREYDEALSFYVGVLGFTLVEDTFVPEQNKRWVVVAPPGESGARLLLARASNDDQVRAIGNQTGGRVFLFLHTNDFTRDYERYKAAGVRFVRDPARHPYGIVAVFADLYGNLWDLIGD